MEAKEINNTSFTLGCYFKTIILKLVQMQDDNKIVFLFSYQATLLLILTENRLRDQI